MVNPISEQIKVPLSYVCAPNYLFLLAHNIVENAKFILNLKQKVLPSLVHLLLLFHLGPNVRMTCKNNLLHYVNLHKYKNYHNNYHKSHAQKEALSIEEMLYVVSVPMDTDLKI